MATIHADKQYFETVLAKSEKPVLLDFFATWCGPCRMIAPVIEEIAAEHPEIVVAKIDVDQAPELAQQFGIVSIPTLIVLKNGQTVAKQVGALPKDDILALIEKA